MDARMKLDVDLLVKSEYDLSVKAEEAFVTKSNSLRRQPKRRLFNCKKLGKNYRCRCKPPNSR